MLLKRDTGPQETRINHVFALHLFDKMPCPYTCFEGEGLDLCSRSRCKQSVLLIRIKGRGDGIETSMEGRQRRDGDAIRKLLPAIVIWAVPQRGNITYQQAYCSSPGGRKRVHARQLHIPS